ncbi:ECF transporter S component [Thermococcus camini]|uniref:Membrane protein, conserved n=1 Tax=Thermococcus camini TaxID=2016373 RepID=A0A7G2DAI2_9EURY|nr:ECF transporter S component [Thermococcus camini]CAD5245267.1 Membrane protein, conserved [Thermococcus camini]
MTELTEMLKPYGPYVLAAVTLLYVAYLFMNRKKFRSASVLALSAVMAAVVGVTTAFITIATPATGGYLNLGDTMVMFSAMVFGPVIGVFAGGVGSALGDIIAGYPGWAPITLVVKGLEGLAVGYIARRSDNVSTLVIAGLVGGIIMVSGYFAFEVYMFGVPAAATEVPGNMLQAVTGVIVGTVLARAIKKRYPEIEDLL